MDYYIDSEGNFICTVTIDRTVIIPENYQISTNLKFATPQEEFVHSTYPDPASESCESTEAEKTICSYTYSLEEYTEELGSYQDQVVETTCSITLQDGYSNLDEDSMTIPTNEEEICEDFDIPELNEAQQLHLSVLERWTPDSTLEELDSFVRDLSLSAGRYIGAREEVGDQAYLERAQTLMTLYKVEQDIERKGGIVNPEINLIGAENEYHELASVTSDNKMRSLAYTQLAIIDLNDQRDLESAYLWASKAVESDPSNEGARELHKALRVGMLEGINKRLSENANKVLEYSLFKDERVLSDDTGSLTYTYVSLKEGFLNPVNALREITLPSIDKQAVWYPLLIDTKFGVASILNFERKGGNLNQFYELVDKPSEQTEYVKSIYPDKSQSELNQVRTAMNFALRNPDVNFVARNGEFDSLRETTNADGEDILVDKFGYEVKRELVYAHGGGYFRDFTFQKSWYDSVLSEVNGLNALIYLGPSGLCSSLSKTAIGKTAIAKAGMLLSTRAQVGITTTSLVGSSAIAYAGGPPWLSDFVDITGDLLTPGKGDLVDGTARKVGKNLALEFSDEFTDQVAIRLTANGLDDAYDTARRLSDDLATGRIATKGEIADSVGLTVDEIDDIASKAWHNAQIERNPEWWWVKQGDNLAGHEVTGHAAARMKPDEFLYPDPSGGIVIKDVRYSKGRGIPAPVVEDTLLNPVSPPILNDRNAYEYISRTTIVRNGNEHHIVVIVAADTNRIKTVEIVAN
jgi:hypothetical protein